MSSPRAKKSLGQNFLKSQHVLSSIGNIASVGEGDSVLEIGPGKGALTRELLNRGAQVVAVELDQRLLPLLQERFAQEISSGQLTLVHGDILDENLKFPASIREGKYHLVANIPYYITNAIIRRFLEQGPRPRQMVLLVQKEVADRIVARDGKESLLSLSVKLFGKPRIRMRVPRRFFSPVPNVDSAILQIQSIRIPEEISQEEFQDFFQLLRTGFAQKRKQVKKLLSGLHGSDAISRAFSECKIPKTARAENLSLDQWKCIFSFLRRIEKK